MSYFGSVAGITQPLGIDLEREALGAFGDYVDNQNRIDNFKALGLSDEDARALSAESRLGEFNVRSPAGSNAMIAPKQRFLFQVEIDLNPLVYQAVSREVSELVLKKFGFFVKSIDRPKVEYIYEDVNMYNYRTRVHTQTKQQPIKMNFWDDARNTVGEFINIYRKAHSAAARQETMEAGNPEETGFTFSHGILDASIRDFSHRSFLPNNAKTFIKKLVVKQIYSTHSTHQSSAFALTEYTFLNPVITSFDIDDVNHESNESNGVMVEFQYDSLHIDDYEVSSIFRDSELPDYYHFISGKKIVDNLTRLGPANRLTKGGIGIPRQGFNWLDEAKRAVLSGNPVSYAMERGKYILRQGDEGLGFKGVRGVVDGVTGNNPSTSLPPQNPPVYTDP